MKKKIKLIVLFLVVLLCTCGCDMFYAGTTRDIRHAGYSVSNADFECPTLFPSDDGFEEIQFFTNIYAITTDGKFYTLSLGKKYQNGLNCKVPDNFANKKVKAIMDNKVVKMDDGKYYYIVTSGDSAAYTEVPMNDSNYPVYRLLFNDSSILKVITVDASNGYYYVLKSDGNVYNMVISRNGDSIFLASSSVVYSKSNYNGAIVDFGYAGNSSSTYILTETQIFRMLMQNKEECTKYADVLCKYEMQLDTGLSEHIDEILGFGGNFLITDYGKQFSATS